MKKLFFIILIFSLIFQTAFCELWQVKKIENFSNLSGFYTRGNSNFVDGSLNSNDGSTNNLAEEEIVKHLKEKFNNVKFYLGNGQLKIWGESFYEHCRLTGEYSDGTFFGNLNYSTPGYSKIEDLKGKVIKKNKNELTLEVQYFYSGSISVVTGRAENNFSGTYSSREVKGKFNLILSKDIKNKNSKIIAILISTNSLNHENMKEEASSGNTVEAVYQNAMNSSDNFMASSRTASIFNSGYWEFCEDGTLTYILDSTEGLNIYPGLLKLKGTWGNNEKNSTYFIRASAEDPEINIGIGLDWEVEVSGLIFLQDNTVYNHFEIKHKTMNDEYFYGDNLPVYLFSQVLIPLE